MLPSLITNKDWIWNIKKCFTKINEKININIQTQKQKLTISIIWKPYQKKPLNGGSKVFTPKFTHVGGGKYQTNHKQQ
jgi:hypothetical protein